MVFTAEVTLLLLSYFPLEKTAASLCVKNSIYYVRLKVRETEEYPQFGSDLQKGIMKGQKWCLRISVPSGKFIDKPVKFYNLLGLQERKTNQNTQTQKVAPESIFNILILEEKLWNIHKLLKPLVKLLSFLAQKNQFVWDLLEIRLFHLGLHLVVIPYGRQ